MGGLCTPVGGVHSGRGVDYFSDPWHASAFHKENQRYNAKLPLAQQATTWTFPMSQLNEFQCEVPMNANGPNPRASGKHWDQATG